MLEVITNINIKEFSVFNVQVMFEYACVALENPISTARFFINKNEHVFVLILIPVI